MCHVPQTQQQTLGAIEHNLLSSQIHPFFVLSAASWLYKILGVQLDRHRTASRLLRFAMVLIISNFIIIRFELVQVVEVILAIHDSGIALAQIFIGQSCDLIKCVQSTLYKQTLSV